MTNQKLRDVGQRAPSITLSIRNDKPDHPTSHVASIKTKDSSKKIKLRDRCVRRQVSASFLSLILSMILDSKQQLATKKVLLCWMKCRVDSSLLNTKNRKIPSGNNALKIQM